MSATTTSTQILHHTSAFLSEIFSQPDLRHLLSSTFLQKLPTTLVKPLNFAYQTIENAISATSPSIRSSSLHLAEKLILSNSKTPFSYFLLSLIHHLYNRTIDASLGLLDVFHSDPLLARLEIAPFLFQELFLIHFNPIIEWYNEKRSSILSLNSSAGKFCNSDDIDQSIVSGTSTTLLCNMSEVQASALKDLERDYEVLLEENCRIFVDYFKEVLRNKDGDHISVVRPAVVLDKSQINADDELVNSDEEIREKIKTQKWFASNNRRYNPIWSELGDKSVELSFSRGKNLSKFPSLYPERVSPKDFTNQIRPSKNSPDHNSSDYSSSDSEAEHKEKLKKSALFDEVKSQYPQIKQKKPLSAEESSRSPNSFMENSDNFSGGGKNTPPKDFVCPITTHIFNDPVTLETGQTYERKAIQEWIDRGNSTCPITRQTLHSTQLPKTNYVLKRLIASWLERNPSPLSPTSSEVSIQNLSEQNSSSNKSSKVNTIRSLSPNSVISQATMEVTMTELRLAITDLCTSEILREAELSVLKIKRFWMQEGNDLQVGTMQSMLVKPPVINSFVEVLFNSVDRQVLRSTILLLTELGSRDDNVVATLTRVDSDVECLVELFKKGLSEAIVLVHILRPSGNSLVEMDLVDYLLAMIGNMDDDGFDDDGDDDDFVKMCVKPRTAALILLGHVIRNSDEMNQLEIVRSIFSTKAIDKVVVSLKGEEVEEMIAAVSILLRCMLEEGKCRNIIAEKAELASMLEIFGRVNDGERFEIVHFLYELVKLNSRSFSEQILHILKDEGTFSTMHTLLSYLQSSIQDQSPIMAGLLLQLDLLDEPRKMSIYREEAIDTLISCLRNSEFPIVQIRAAETVLVLQGRFSYSGKSLSRAILLKRAGLDRSYKAFMRKEERYRNISGQSQDTTEDEKAATEWERKVAFVLVSHEFGLLFEALAEGLKSEHEELHSVCFMAAAWLVYMLSILPDTGIRGAARLCLLKHFVSIFKSEKNIEDRAISMLAINSFIHDPEGLQDLSGHMKDILKGLRELKKFSAMAFEMLKVISEEHDNSADIWSHKKLCHEDCRINGEVLAITCFKGKIFSGHSDGTIKVWSSEDSELQLFQEVREHTKAVTSLSVLHSSVKLYSGSLDRTVRIWSVNEEGIYCEQVEEMKDQINNLVIANSMACYIPQGAGVKVHSWNGSSRLVNQQKYAKCLALVQGKLYCGCQDSSIQEIDLATGTIGNIQSGSKKLLGKPYPIYALQVHDGLIYATGPSFDGGNVKIWSTSNYSMVGSLTSTSEVRTIATSSELVYLGCKGGIIEVWCKSKFSKVETLQTSSTTRILCMAFDTSEDILVIGTSDGRIQTWGLS